MDDRIWTLLATASVITISGATAVAELMGIRVHPSAPNDASADSEASGESSDSAQQRRRRRQRRVHEHAEDSDEEDADEEGDEAEGVYGDGKRAEACELF